MKESFETSITLRSSSQYWLLVEGLYLNKYFFKRGLLLVSPNEEHQSHVSYEEKSFKLNDREFMFYMEGSAKKKLHNPKNREINKAKNLLYSLVNFANSNHFDIRTPKEDSRVLFNRFRKNEIFLPLLFGNEDNSTGVYIYPWIAKSATISFSGFSQFVTAGCMFGAAIKGITENGDCIELINHQLHLPPGEKITAILFDITAENPFEDVLFHQFQNTCQLIRAIATFGKPLSLLYHLPDIDYIMFGIKLFIYEQMSYNALEQFICITLTQRERHQTILRNICHTHNIAITFDSPFYNLLPNIDMRDPVQSIMSQLGITTQDITSAHNQSERERQFTAACLLKLMSNEHNENHALVWQDFINIESKHPETLEELFKIGNAVMIATASRGQADYQTCSLLPLSEKQIQIMYEQCRSKHTKLFPNEYPCYPANVNLTLFDPVITYSPTTSGLLFYFAYCLASLSFLITEKKLVDHAARNLSLFTNKIKKTHELLSNDEKLLSKPIELQDIVSELSIIPHNPMQ